MDTILLSSLSCLTTRVQDVKKFEQKGYRVLSDLLLNSPTDISLTTGVDEHVVAEIVKAACWECAAPIDKIKDLPPPRGEEKITTGDPELDGMLGGGIRTGMLWEVVGESAAGKTQLALQLSLLVQLPPRLGGILGSAFYLTVASQLQTTRMEQILNTHPLLSPSLCSFEYIQHTSVPTIDKLIIVLSKLIPEYISRNAQSPSQKPLKLIVIDAIAELFHTTKKTTSQFLVERSRSLSKIGTLLHALASKHQIAILVLNEVSDAFNRSTAPLESGQIGYQDQFQWFGRAESGLGEGKKEATLGLVWSNQLNARIFLSRTGRRRYLEESERPGKFSEPIPAMPSVNNNTSEDQPLLIRRLTVVFSSVCDPATCDYIVTAEGISVIPGSVVPLATRSVVGGASAGAHASSSPREDLNQKQSVQVAPLDIGTLADSDAIENRPCTPENEPVDDDEWDAFWERNELPELAFEETVKVNSTPSSTITIP